MSSAEKNTSEKKSSEKKVTEKKSTEKKADDSALPSVITDGGRVVKMEVDYSTTCDEKIPAAHQLAKEGRVQEAVESLMVLEKQTRTGADAHSTSRVLVAIVEICFGAGDWNLMNESIVTLTKKRSQIKMAVTKMVQKCCEYVDQTPDKETKLKLMDTLRTVTAGKIYVEVERARLTHKLAMMKEAEGDITEAATILQELQVETFGSMERKEKVEMILEQMRLCLLKKDFVRTQIISKKISTKFFDNEKVDDLKLKFYNLMIELDSHEGSFLSICRHYRAIYDSKSVQEDETEKKRILKHVILFIILAPYDNEQNDLLHRIKEDKTLEEIPQYKDLLQLFVTAELIKWSGLCDVYEAELRSNANTVFPKNEEGDNRWTQLKNRVVEHNIRMMAKYYTRIHLKRMAELTDMADVDSSKLEMPDFVDPGGYGEVSGEITIPGTVGKAQADEYNTLDEPVRETIQKGKEASTGESEPRQYNTLEEPVSVTIMRDLRAVGTKFYHVLYPKEKKALLKEWDLWGPLILCTFLAMMVQGSEDADSGDGGPEFAQVFVIVWVGAAVVTMNTKLLGGTISFFQSVCVLGYCLLPCCGSLILCRLILIATQNKLLFILRFIVTVIGFVWATFAAMVFLGDSQPSSRKALAVYPILLFYFVISWLILSHTNV